MALPRNLSSIPTLATMSDRLLCEVQEEKALKLEDTSPLRFFTWNPNPKFYDYSKFTDNDYNEQWKVMITKLLKIYRCSKLFVILPEISDKGKLHCHGWFHITDPVKYHKQFQPTMNRHGFVKIDKISKVSGNTFGYYKKELDKSKLLLDEFDLLPITPDTYVYTKRISDEYLTSLMLVPIHEDDHKKYKKKNVLLMLKMCGLLKSTYDSDN